jgi:hypothetical protein
VLASQAHALWRTRASLVPRNAAIEWLSRAVLLALFAVVIIARDALMQFRWNELPAVLLPFAVVAMAGWWLRRMNVQITFTHMPQVRLPFEAAPALQRLQLDLTLWLARMKAVGMALLLPHVQFDQHEALQTILLFAQRMSHHWLGLRAMIEAAIEVIFTFIQAGCVWITSPLQVLLRTTENLTRAPQVIALRC